VDKLESIPGFESSLSDAAFLHQAREVGVVITGQSKELAPADGLLYALRDVTATVQSLPLIASSVMSKKIAGGARAIVLDVTVGSGSFIKTLPDARALAQTMSAIGRHHGRRVRTVLSSMAQPLGRAVGNAIEVREAIACLRGEGPEDLRELCLVLAAEVLEASGLSADRAALDRALDGGSAYARFERWIAAQGGDVRALDRLPLAPGRAEVRAPRGGVLTELDALAVGRAVGMLGGGRARKGDPIDAGVGVELLAKVGDTVSSGDAIVSVFHRDGRGLDAALATLEQALKIGEEAHPTPLVLETGPA